MSAATPRKATMIMALPFMIASSSSSLVRVPWSWGRHLAERLQRLFEAGDLDAEAVELLLHVARHAVHRLGVERAHVDDLGRQRGQQGRKPRQVRDGAGVRVHDLLECAQVILPCKERLLVLAAGLL